MTDFKRIVDKLREAGVHEVILIEKNGVPLISFYGESPDGERFVTEATNADFSEHDM